MSAKGAARVLHVSDSLDPQCLVPLPPVPPPNHASLLCALLLRARCVWYAVGVVPVPSVADPLDAMHEEHRAELQKLLDDAASRRKPIDVELLVRAATEAVDKKAAAFAEDAALAPVAAPAAARAAASAAGEAAAAVGALALGRDRLQMDDVLCFVRRTADPRHANVEVRFDGKAFVFKYQFDHQALPRPVAS